MILPHVNLGEIGVVGDQNGQALPVNAWTDSLNVRFTNLGIEKIAESTLRIPTVYDFKIFTTKLRNGNVHIFAASRGGLHMYDGTEWYFTPAEVSPEAVWHFTHWGDTVIFNCVEYPPFMFDWDTVDAPEEVAENGYFVPLPKWGIISTEWDITAGADPSFDTEARCERLVAYKSQLVAVGIKHKEPVEKDLGDGVPTPDRDPLYSYKPPTEYSDGVDLQEGDQWYQVLTNDFDYDNPDPEGLPLWIRSDDNKWNPFEDDRPKEYEKTEYKDKNNVVWVSDTTSDPTYKVPEGEAGGGADAGVSGAVQGGPPSWDYISPATLSVQQVVGAADGRYIAAEPLNDSIIIYTPAAAHALVFTGGQYVVQTRRLFERGAAGPYCVCEFSNNHFVVDGDQLYIHDGSTATRVGEDMFDVEFFKRAVNLKNTTLCHDQENREIWVYFDTLYGRKGCVFSYSTGTFGWVDGEAGNQPITYARRGYLPQAGAQWADMTQPWKDYQEPDDYTLWPEEWSGGFGIRMGDVEGGENTLINNPGYEELTQWNMGIGASNLIEYPPHKFSVKWKTEKAELPDGAFVLWKNPWKFLAPKSHPDYLGPTWSLKLLINGHEVTEQQLYSGQDNFSDWDIDWKEKYNPQSTEPAEFELQMAVNDSFIEIAQLANVFSALLETPDSYKIGSLNPAYEGSERWRWNDQFTYTNRYHILALTPYGIYQKEAFFSKERESWVERKAIDLDDAGINGWVIKHLKQYHMQLAGEGKVGVRTGWAESALADPVWEKPTWLDENGPGSYQADMRTSGRYLSLRFEFKEMGQFRWANGYMDIEVSGRR